MYTRLLTLVLLFGACLAAPQQTITVEGSASATIPEVPIPDPNLPEVPIPDPNLPAIETPEFPAVVLPELPPAPEIPSVPLPEVPALPSVPEVPDLPSVPEVPALPTVPQLPENPILNVDELEVGLPHVDDQGNVVLLSLDAQLRLLGLDVFADILVQFPLSTLVPPGTSVTIPGIPNEQLTQILNGFKDFFGNLRPDKVKEFLKSVILRDLHFKQQLAEAGLGAIKNLLNKTQNLQGYSDGACVWNGGEIVQPDVPFAGGLIQKLSDFVPKLQETLGQALAKVGGAVGGLLNTVLNTLKALPARLFPFDNIFNNVNGPGSTFIVPTQAQLQQMLSPLQLANLPNAIKQHILNGAVSPADLAHLDQVTNFLNQPVPISYSTSNTATIGGHTLNWDYFLSSAGGNVLVPQ